MGPEGRQAVVAGRAASAASWVFAIAMLVGTWFLISVIEDASWGAGDRRALVTLALLVLTMIVAAIAGRKRRRTGSTRPAIGLVATILLCAACLPALRTQVELGVTRFKAPHLNDIPLTTMAAARVMASGRNPYSTPVDPRAESAEQGRNYDGFKYLPMMAVAFAPAALLDSARGVIVINACLHIATAVLIFAAARILAGSLAASFSLILYLWLSLVPRQMFTSGVTDYAAVVPLLVAFLLTDRRAWLAGLLVGLSLSAKLVPAAAVAAIIAPAALPWRPGPGRRYWSGFICGCLPSLAYLLWAPGDLISNVLLFNLSRPADSTSWLFEHPNWWRTAATVGLAALFGSVALVRWVTNPDRRGCVLLIVVVTMGTMLLGPVDHGNYQLWWIPWLSILFASSVGPFLVVKT